MCNKKKYILVINWSQINKLMYKKIIKIKNSLLLEVHVQSKI